MMQKYLRQAAPFLLTAAIVAAFFLGVSGFYAAAEERPEDDLLFLLSTIYATLSMFIMESADLEPTNWQLIGARFIAAAILGYGIFVTILNFVRREWTLLKIKYFYRDHFVIFGIGKIGYHLGRELLQAGERVVFIERDEENDQVERIRHHGGRVVLGNAFDREDILRTGLSRCKFCVVLLGNDEANLKLSNFLMRLNYEGVFNEKVRVLAHVDNWYANNFLNDYLDLYNDRNFEFSPFNADIIGARSIFDQFSPLAKVQYQVSENQKGEITIKASENAIAVLGYNETTAAFILENIILSHSPGQCKLDLLLITAEVEQHMQEIRFKFPFIQDYLNLIPVPLQDENFYSETFRRPEFIEKLRLLSGVYVFGDDDAYLMGLANNFKQLLYAEIGEVKEIPVVVCLPENSSVISLLEPRHEEEHTVLDKFQETFNIHLFRLISQTCTKEKLIDQIGETDTLAKTVNYFYSILYDFEHLVPKDKAEAYRALEPELEELFLNHEFKTSDPLLELERLILGKISTTLQLSYYDWEHKLGIQGLWKKLSGLKQLSNRYVARHLNVKIDFLRKIGYPEARKEDIVKFFKVFAPVEHDRWTSEKLAYKFRYGPFPKDRQLKALLKDTLKIHDQIIPYEELDQEMEDKDFNMFLLIPVMKRIRDQLRDHNKSQQS